MFFAVIFPAMKAQLSELTRNLPEIEARVTTALPPLAPLIRTLVARLNVLKPVDLQSWMQRGLSVGMFAAKATTAMVLSVVLTLYFLLEGISTPGW